MLKDVLVELNPTTEMFEVSFGDFDEDKTDEDWTPVLASFFFKSDALVWALNRFNKIEDEEKLFVILDHTQKLEMLAFSDNEIDGVIELIHGGGRNELLCSPMYAKLMGNLSL